MGSTFVNVLLVVLVVLIPIAACIGAAYDWRTEQRWDDEERGKPQ